MQRETPIKKFSMTELSLDCICEFSSAIFIANFAVLLLTSVLTDYWEYRYYDTWALVEQVQRDGLAKVEYPSDTDYYVLLYPYLCEGGNYTSGKHSSNIKSRVRPQTGARLRHGSPHTSPRTTPPPPPPPDCPTSDQAVVIYEEYGNLFRDCDNITDILRVRVGLQKVRAKRCHNFIIHGTEEKDTYTIKPHLEKGAFACAVIAITLMFSSIFLGMTGQITNHITTILVASLMPICSGLFMLTALALFHSKVYVSHRRLDLRRRQDQLDVLQAVMADHREYSFGWSFFLAWISVLTCFLSSWLWVVKLREISHQNDCRRRRRGGVQHDVVYSAVGLSHGHHDTGEDSSGGDLTDTGLEMEVGNATTTSATTQSSSATKKQRQQQMLRRAREQWQETMYGGGYGGAGQGHAGYGYGYNTGYMPLGRTPPSPGTLTVIHASTEPRTV